MSAPTSDFPDWTQPVGTLIRSNQLASNLGGPTFNRPPTTVDTTGWESVMLLFFDNSTVAGKCYVATIEWVNVLGVSETEIITWWSGASFSAGPSYVFHTPVKDSQLRVRIATNDGNTVTVNILGSSRQVTTDRLSNSVLYTGKLLNQQNFGSVAAGATTPPMYIPTVDRAISFSVNVTGGNWDWFINGVELSVQAATSQLYFNGNGNASRFCLPELPAPRMGLSLYLVNTSSSAQSMVARAVDVS